MASPAPFTVRDPEFEIEPPEETEEDFAKEMDEVELLTVLLQYWNSAREGRESGLSARDKEWAQNWDAYWGRYDYSDKESWQSTEQLPDIQNAVDRFSASLRESMMSVPEWYDIDDPADDENQITPHIQRFMKATLDRSGRDQASGHTIGFDHTFYQAMKAGCLMNAAIQVRPDKDGKVIAEVIDARELYYDPTARGLFRIRQYEEDWHELRAKANGDDSPWDAEAIDRLQGQTGGTTEVSDDKDRSSAGQSQPDGSPRQTVTLLEYKCDLVNEEGELVARNQQIVVADEREIVLGPRDNPFWHKQDWIASAPLITVPFSVYGRSWVEGFRQVVDTFVSMTNLVLDAAFVGSMNAYMLWADALEDPSQADSIHPLKVFIASDEVPVGTDFIKEVNLGNISPTTLAVWQGVQAMVRDYSQQNEMSLGQLPSKGDITATEIGSVDRGQSQLVRSTARDIEDRLLSPVLFMIYSTGLQFLDEGDQQLASELGPETFKMLVAQKEDFANRTIHFKAKGISEAIARTARAQAAMAGMQMVGQSPVLQSIFMQEYSAKRFMDQFFADIGISLVQMRATPEEKQAQQAAQAQAAAQAAGPGGGPSGPGGGPGGIPGTAVEG